MSGFERLPGRKALAWRGRGGRFSKPPSLEELGLVRVCAGCGAINARRPELEADGLLGPAKLPKVCRECGGSLETEPPAGDPPTPG